MPCSLPVLQQARGLPVRNMWTFILQRKSEKVSQWAPSQKGELQLTSGGVPDLLVPPDVQMLLFLKHRRSSWHPIPFRLFFLTLWMLKTGACTGVARVRVAKKSWTPFQQVGLEPCKTAFYKELFFLHSELLYIYNFIKIIIKHLLTVAINRTNFCKQKLKRKMALSHFWPASCTKA